MAFARATSLRCYSAITVSPLSLRFAWLNTRVQTPLVKLTISIAFVSFTRSRRICDNPRSSFKSSTPSRQKSTLGRG